SIFLSSVLVSFVVVSNITFPLAMNVATPEKPSDSKTWRKDCILTVRPPPTFIARRKAINLNIAKRRFSRLRSNENQTATCNLFLPPSRQLAGKHGKWASCFLSPKGHVAVNFARGRLWGLPLHSGGVDRVSDPRPAKIILFPAIPHARGDYRESFAVVACPRART